MKAISRDEFKLTSLMIIVVILIVAITCQEARIKEIQGILKEKPVMAASVETVKGEYTLFQYTDAGWINPIYVTEYRLNGQVLLYKEKGCNEWLPMCFSGNLRIVQGWIEGDNLIQYGYWMPDDLDL